MKGNTARARLFRVKKTTDYNVLYHHVFILNLYLTNIEDYISSQVVEAPKSSGHASDSTLASGASAEVELQLIIAGLKQLDSSIRELIVWNVLGLDLHFCHCR